MSKKISLTLLLLLSLGVSLTLVFHTAIFTNRAAVYSDKTPVLTNSYMFASPLQANSKNQEKIRLTVFILDNQGLGVPDQKVTVSSTPFLNIENIQPITNQTGQASFNLSSTTPGVYLINAKLGSNQIPQSISISFY